MITHAQAMFVFVVGLLMTLLGVGGVEHSITDYELMTAVLVSAAGLSVMWVATLMMRQADGR